MAAWIHAQHGTDQVHRGLLERLGDLIPHDYSWFDLSVLDGGQPRYFNPVSTTMSDKQLSDYYEHYEESDYVPWMFGIEESLIYRDFDIINEEAHNKSKIYQEWMRPLGFYYGIGSTIVASGHLYGSITLFRREEGTDFSDDELDVQVPAPGRN